VGNYCGDGFFRNIGDACPAGSKKAKNEPDDYTGRDSAAAEGADKVGSAGACACPENYDKVDFNDGTGWHCVWGDGQNFSNVACVVPAGVGGAGGSNKGARELSLAVSTVAGSLQQCIAQLNRNARIADHIEGSPDPIVFCEAIFHLPSSTDGKYEIVQKAMFSFESVQDCETRVDELRADTKFVKRVTTNGAQLEDIPDTEVLCDELYGIPPPKGSGGKSKDQKTDSPCAGTYAYHYSTDTGVSGDATMDITTLSSGGDIDVRIHDAKESRKYEHGRCGSGSITFSMEDQGAGVCRWVGTYTSDGKMRGTVNGCLIHTTWSATRTRP